MKECKQMMLYLAGELNPQEESVFKRHLAACRACRAELTLWQAAQEPGQAPAAPAPVVEALFAKTTRKPKFWQAFFRPAWVRWRRCWWRAGLCGRNAPDMTAGK